MVDIKITGDKAVRVDIGEWTIWIDDSTDEKLIHTNNPSWITVPKKSRITLEETE